ncbi:MAG: DsbA family protein [Candidatus Gracilibacteria bacterium]|nr:DsbA family protein [Candidatus Gracilibacteria bacterium]MDQ7022429.1 DsbA family protein [Candidatus Gracilibacteria bacterium]
MKNNKEILQMGIIGMVGIVTIMATYLIVDTKTSNVSQDVVAKMLAIEYDKVGGMENYVKITNITREQTIAGLKQYEAQGGAQPAAQPQANNAPAPSAGSTISVEKAKEITQKDTYILGNPDAEITWVEYSDLECPFCKRLHEAGTIEEVMKAYDGKVNFVFKQFPLGFHAQAQMEAEALLCAGDLNGTDKYYEFINKIFAGSKTNGRSYTKESISELGSTIGIDKTKLLSCITSGKFTEKAKAEMAEGQSLFGITGTPGNVLINNKTGKWDKLPGAYPTAAFKEKIDLLLQ